MWNCIAKNDRDVISLHDSRATGIHMDGKDLVLDFADGFWLVHGSRYNPHENTLRTDAAQVRFVDFEIENFYVFKVVRLFRKPIFTKRIEMDLQTLIDNVNSGAWELEFLDEYTRFRGLLFNCWIWHKKGHTQECQISMDCTETQYYWNSIREDRIW